jgi:PAS domain S-box-containing protein
MSNKKIKILHLEDSAGDVDFVDHILKKAGLEFETLVVDTRSDYVRALKEFLPDVVLSDHSLPAFNSVNALEILKDLGARIPFILVTGAVSEEFAAEVIMQGADDYVLKDRPQRLPNAILNALEKYSEARKKELAEEKVRQSEANLTAIIENTGALVYSLDKQFRYITFNGVLKTAILEVHGITIKPGDKIFEFLETKDLAEALAWEKIYTEAISGKPLQIVKDYSRPGAPFFLHFSINPIWENDRVTGLSCMARDITRDKLAEDELRAGEQRYRFISQNPLLGVVWISNDGKILNANEAFCNMIGYSNLEIIDHHYSTYTFRDDVSQQYAAIKQLLAGDIDSHRTEKRYTHKNGHLMWGELILSPVKNNEGAVKYLIGIVQDITQRKKAESEIVSLNESLEIKIKERTLELQQANRHLEGFSHAVAHDLQSPLRVVNGFAKILLDDYSGKLDDEGKEQLHFISAKARQMSQLVKDLLAFSKGAKTSVVKSSVDMNEIVNDILEDIKMSEPDFKGAVKVQTLPPAFCNAALIKQVWTNLILNAIKYSRKKEHPIIEIGAEITEGKQTYYVKDNGVGFDMNQACKLFEVFQRLHSSEDFEGSGVGLATVHRIITRHGGRVWVNAKKDEGATFYFTAGGQ